MSLNTLRSKGVRIAVPAVYAALLMLKVFGNEEAPPGVCQHLLGEVRGTVSRLVDLTHALEGGRLGAEVHLRELGVAHDPHEEVVEIMGDTTSQQAEAVELLVVPDLRL